MASTFFGLNTALSGLVAQQRALNTVNHNIANANTEGFTRQRVDMAAAPAYALPAYNNPVGPGQQGTGVVTAEHSRLRDQFTDLQFRAQNAAFGQFEARSGSLDRLNQVIDEPGPTGINTLLGKFWDGWQALSRTPEAPSAREAIRAAGISLSEGFQDMRAQLVSSQTEANGRIGETVVQVNAAANQLNTLNQAIAKVTAVGQTPNDLLDQRDVLIDAISKSANIAVTTPAANGKVSVTLGGQLLVDGTTDTVNALAVSGAGVVTVGAAVATVTDGSLRGQIDIRDTVIGGVGGYIDQLDTLAATVITEVNNRHAAGYALDGTTGNNFLTGTSAANMAVDPTVITSINKIAASDTAANLPGGGNNAVRLAQLQDVVLTIGASTTTINGFYQGVISRLGVDTDQADRLAQVQKGVLDSAISRRDAVSGVNLDEEVSDMVRFQKSYSAAARMITTLDDMLETIVNRMGIVGR
jgi:flagellar hook-associated protein 1